MQNAIFIICIAPNPNSLLLFVCLFARKTDFVQKLFLQWTYGWVGEHTPKPQLTLFPRCSRDSISWLPLLLSFLICHMWVSRMQHTLGYITDDAWVSTAYNSGLLPTLLSGLLLLFFLFTKIKSPTVAAQLYVNIFIKIETIAGFGKCHLKI